MRERENTSFATACRRWISVGFLFSWPNPKDWFIFCSTWIQADSVIKPDMIKRHLASLKITCTVVSIWRNRSSAHWSFHAWRQVGRWESLSNLYLLERRPSSWRLGPKQRPTQQNLQLLEIWRYLPSACLTSLALPERCWYLSLRLKRIAGFLPSCHWLICLSKLHAIFYHRDQWEALGETSVSYFGCSQGWEIIAIAGERGFWTHFRMM